METPDHATRPKLVVWAYRCWVISGALLIALGVLAIVLGIFTSGPTLGPVGIGVIIAAVGGAYVLMGSKAFTGDARWRSSLAALTLVVVIMLVIIGFVYPIFAIALLVALVGLVGSLLAFRPDSEAWYTETPQKK
ncbi:hypothetical protein AAFP30_15575 [Gordonia sp. CPCC 205515]|uniref:hypothetical protein n=1 Tax=Gordonia sp. CPCC 205515 TaxID=3140791 RepID=UPI003AF3CAAF